VVQWTTYVCDFPIVNPVTISLSRTVSEIQRLSSYSRKRAIFIAVVYTVMLVLGLGPVLKDS